MNQRYTLIREAGKIGPQITAQLWNYHIGCCKPAPESHSRTVIIWIFHVFFTIYPQKTFYVYKKFIRNGHVIFKEE